MFTTTYRVTARVRRKAAAIRDGFSENRRRLVVAEGFDADFYAYCYKAYLAETTDPLEHYLKIGSAKGFDPHPEFCARDYIATCSTLSQGVDPYYHYLSAPSAAKSSVKPSMRRVEYFTAKLFDWSYYFSRYEDVRSAPIGPLLHYMEFGWREGRDPSGGFSTNYYLQEYEDVRASDVNPLFHYARYGAVEGRRPTALPGSNGSPSPAANNNEEQVGGLATLFSRLAHRQPEFTSKWLRTNYLAVGLSELQRARAFTHHYDIVVREIPEPLLEDVFFRSLELWRGAFDGVDHWIRLKLSTPSMVEGELSLEFLVDHHVLYTLSFSFVPKDWSGRSEGTQILVSRLQGPKDRWAEFKSASQRMKDVSAPFALMAALQGVARALDVSKVAAVSALRQPARGKDHPADFESTYDRFFAALGLKMDSNQLFGAELPLAEKPMSEVKKGHRIRTRIKREIKRQIANAAAAVLTLEQTGVVEANAPTVADEKSPPDWLGGLDHRAAI